MTAKALTCEKHLLTSTLLRKQMQLLINDIQLNKIITKFPSIFRLQEKQKHLLYVCLNFSLLFISFFFCFCSSSNIPNTCTRYTFLKFGFFIQIFLTLVLCYFFVFQYIIFYRLFLSHKNVFFHLFLFQFSVFFLLYFVLGFSLSHLPRNILYY